MPAALLPLLAPFASDSFIHCTDRRSLGRQSVRLSLPLPLPLCPPLPTALSVRAVAALRPHWHGHASQWQPTNLSQVVRTVKKIQKHKKKESPKKRTTNFIFVAKTPLSPPSLPTLREGKNNNQFIWLCCKLLLDSLSLTRIQSSSSSSSSFWRPENLRLLIIKNR